MIDSPSSTSDVLSSCATDTPWMLPIVALLAVTGSSPITAPVGPVTAPVGDVEGGHGECLSEHVSGDQRREGQHHPEQRAARGVGDWRTSWWRN